MDATTALGRRNSRNVMPGADWLWSRPVPTEVFARDGATKRTAYRHATEPTLRRVSTRRLILLALACGVAILLAGGVQLLLISR